MTHLRTAMLLAILTTAFHAPATWAEDESNPDYDEDPPKHPCIEAGVSGCECMELLGIATANPVVIASGNKIRPETDFRSAHDMPLELSRNFSAQDSVKVGLFGARWLSNLDQSLRFTFTGGGICDAVPSATAACMLPTHANTIIASVTRLGGDGAQEVFEYHAASQTWKSPAVDAHATVVRNADKTWTIQYQSGAVERYNVEGFLTEVRNAENVSHAFTYSGRHLQRVTHSGGQYIQLGWSGSRITSATDPAGNVFTYGYTADGHLNQVVLPGPPAVTRTYHYEGAPGLMTGVSVNGVRHATNDYYPDGRAHHSGLAGGLETDTFAYGTNPDGTSYTAVTNVAGATTTYVFADVAGGRKLVRNDRANISYCPNHASQTFYDASGFKDYTLDFNGNRTEYTYAANGLLEDFTTGINAAFPGKQRHTDNVWDATKKRLTGVKVYGTSTAEPLSETVYEYYGPTDPAPNRLKSVSQYNRSPHGVANQLRKTSYSYTVHPNGLVATLVEDGPRTDATDTTTYQYDHAGNLTSVTNALGHVVSYAGHNGLGLPSTVTDANGLVRSYTYDGQGRILTETLHLPTGPRTTTYAWHRLGGIATITRPDGSVVNTHYDDVGRVTQTDGGGDQEIAYAYNALGKLIQTEHKRVCPGGGCTPTVHYRAQSEYDQVGRKLADLGANGQRTDYRYDAFGNPVRSERLGSPNRVTTQEYGPNHELLSHVDALNKTTGFTYDGAGRLATLTDPNNQTTTYRHDGLGNLVQLISQDTGTTTRTYDEAGNVKTETDARGVVVTYTWDALNRLTLKTTNQAATPKEPLNNPII